MIVFRMDILSENIKNACVCVCVCVCVDFQLIEFDIPKLQTSANYDQLGQLIMSPAGPEH
jgi:hypothetical protein